MFQLTAEVRQTFVKILSAGDCQVPASWSFEVVVFVPCGGWDRFVSEINKQMKED